MDVDASENQYFVRMQFRDHGLPLLGSVNRCHLPSILVSPNDSEPAPRFTVATKQARTEPGSQFSIGNRLVPGIGLLNWHPGNFGPSTG